MKKINKIALILSFITLLVIFSGISMIALPKEYRYNWVSMNPWNGVEGVMLTVQRFLGTGEILTYILSFALIIFLWWRLYAVILRYFPKREEE
ncbi:hypothetical protein LJB94_01285 [Odoribacter sp. OttesenSCG-928-G04]|nr:hypothetical protein [Odoribacter sp. OttesenSCG-928-G04]MDL2330489.1 hypothetical protein [Odoribacter sp. OttesenSCG-928-A06]